MVVVVGPERRAFKVGSFRLRFKRGRAMVWSKVAAEKSFSSKTGLVLKYFLKPNY